MPPSVYKRPLLWVLICYILGLLFFYRSTPADKDIFYAITKESVQITAVVENFYTPKPKSNNVILKVLSINGQKAQGRVYARFTDFAPRWKDTLTVRGKLQVPYGEDIIGNFNWRNYLRTKEVFTEIKPAEVKIEKPAAWFFRAVRFVRADILRVFARYFDEDLAPIAGGILLGERGELDPDLFNAFQDSGAIHLLVASGGNVGFVMLMSVAVLVFFRFGNRSRLVGALAVAGVYTLIAGADAPLLRAYFMAVSATLGYILARDSGLFQGLIIACLVILIKWPASLFETGFQMSFLATLAIIITGENFHLPEKLPRWVYFFFQIFLATLASQLALLPIFTNVFYKVSLAGLAANMVLVPFASVLLMLSFAFYVFAKMHLAAFLFFPTMCSLELFKRLVEFFAGFSFSSVPVTAWKTGTIICYYAGLFGLFNLPYRKFVRKYFFCAAVLCTAVLAVQHFYFAGPRVCLIRSGNWGTAIVQTRREFFVVGDTLPADKLRNALYKLGTPRTTALLGLRAERPKEDVSPLAQQVIFPFEADNWPEKDYMFGNTRVQLTWGLWRTKNNTIYQKEGYGGRGNKSVSYCFYFEDKKVCVGAGGTFILNGDSVFLGKQNRTVCQKI